MPGQVCIKALFIQKAQKRSQNVLNVPDI